MSTAPTQTSCEVPGLGPETYARWRASEVGRITDRLERELILELAGDVRGQRILDIGCGDGKLALELHKRGATVTGIDVSPAMIEAAKQRASQAGAEIDFRVAAAQEIPFPPEQFDMATAITILCFVEEPSPVFREVARVLRPGGRFVIGELGRWSSWAAARRIRAWLGSQLWRRALFRTPRELRSYAEQAGLRLEAMRGAVFYPRFTPVARLLRPLDLAIGRHTTHGAAFLAISAQKAGSKD